MSTSRAHVLGIWVPLFVACAIPLGSAAEKAKLQIPAVQKLTLDTHDGVALRCSYYPGGFVENFKTKEVTAVPGTEVIPILMLHGWDGQRSDFDYTAGFLQRLGHAVLAPDLRGHGESLKRRQGAREVPIDRGSLRAAEIRSTLLDVDACKRFLLERNNAKELNIELLCVVGAEFGATLAVNWAVVDWSWPQLPGYKQGRDVKSLVLLSPVQSFKGVHWNEALKHPVIRNGLSIMIVAGTGDESGHRIAKSLHDRLLKARGPLSNDPKERQQKQDLFWMEPATSLSGAKLLTPKGLNVNQDLAGFLHLRLGSKKGDFPWTERKHPLAGP